MNELYPKLLGRCRFHLKLFTMDIWSELSANVMLINLTTQGITEDFRCVKLILKFQSQHDRHNRGLICGEIKKTLCKSEI